MLDSFLDAIKNRIIIIAEAGVNHNGDIEIAFKMVDEAKKAGADAVKFQTFRAEKLVTQKAGMAEYQKISTGKSDSQFEMLKGLELTCDDHRRLLEYCKDKEIMFMSTAFDFDSVDLLNDIQVEVFKVSSGDLTNKPLLKYIAQKGKPMIVSTGMATLGEIEEALLWVKDEGLNDIFLLHCTTDYPAHMEEVNLRAIKSIREAFRYPVGYSDHTKGIEVSIAAAALGACIIEKHFTLDRNMEGPDHKASLEPDELKSMISAVRNIENALGDGIKRITTSEEGIKVNARKSIVAACRIEKGETIEHRHLDIKRPETGLQPKHLDLVIGKKASRTIDRDETIKIGDFVF